MLARVTMTAAGHERHNPNYVGGDINGGLASLRQTIFGPSARWNPYRTRCAASTCARRPPRRVAACPCPT
jgi:phytoene dehydrogenase-like protein